MGDTVFSEVDTKHENNFRKYFTIIYPSEKVGATTSKERTVEMLEGLTYDIRKPHNPIHTLTAFNRFFITLAADISLTVAVYEISRACFLLESLNNTDEYLDCKIVTKGPVHPDNNPTFGNEVASDTDLRPLTKKFIGCKVERESVDYRIEDMHMKTFELKGLGVRTEYKDGTVPTMIGAGNYPTSNQADHENRAANADVLWNA